MKEFEQRRRFRRIFFSRFSFLFFLCVAVLLSFSVFDMYKKGRQAVLRNNAVEDEFNELREKKDSLEASLNNLKTDTGVEAELRKKFQIKKPGEEFVVFVDKTEDKPAEEKQEEGGGVFFKKFIDLFGF